MSVNTDNKTEGRCRRRAALRLLKQEVLTMSWRYPAFLFIAAVIAFTATLPPKIYVLYSEHVAGTGIDAVSAQQFMLQLAWFGGVIAVVMLLSTLASSVAEEWICLTVESSLRRRVMQQMQQFPLERFAEAQRGDWLTRMSRDLQNTERFISFSLPSQLRDTVTLIAIAVVFFQYTGWLAAGLIASAFFLAVLNAVIQYRLTPSFDVLRVMHADIMQSLIENFEGIRSIRSLGFAKRIGLNFDKSIEQIYGRSLQVAKKVGLLRGSNIFVTNTTTTIGLCAIAWSLKGGNFTVADALAYPFYIGMFYNATLGLVSSILDWNHFFIESGRFAETFASESSAVKSTPAIELGGNSMSDCQEIELRNVRLTFKSDLERITSDFDLCLRRGETLLITGYSGSGKSTLLETLAGLRALHARTVIVRDRHDRIISNRVIRHDETLYLPLDFANLVEQRAFVFAGSVRENLAKSAADLHDDARMHEALVKANLDHVLNDRGGLDLVIQDGGRNLSEGQKYRLSLARAFAQEQPILLLDEPFAALDEASVDVIVHSLNQVRTNRAVVIVSHITPSGLKVDQTLDLSAFAMQMGHAQPRSESPDFAHPNATVQQSDVPNQPLTRGTPRAEAVLDSEGPFN